MDTNIILVFALILFSTKLCGIITKRIHLPQVVGALIAGILMGPSVFNFIQPNETINVIAELGVIVLLFSAGMETDFKQLRHSLKSTLLISVLGVALALGGGFISASLIGKSNFESFFIGVIIAAMSTSISVEALSEMGKLKTKSGTAILGASVIDDILGITILALVIGSSRGDFSLPSIGITFGKIILFFIFAILLSMAANRALSFIHDKLGYKRRLSIFALAFCFLMAYLAEVFGLADITGAYIAGVAFSNTRYNEYLEAKTNVISYMILSPVFFASIGINMVFSGLDMSMVLFSVALLLAAILSKVIGCGAGARLCGYSGKESVQIGVGMITRGEVSIIVANKGINEGLMEPDIFSCVITVVLITVLVAPVLMKVVYSDRFMRGKAR